MKIILNEKEYSLNALENVIVDQKSPTLTLNIVSKYLMNEGMTKKEVKNELNTLMAKGYPFYNAIKWDSIIDKIVNKVFKKGVPIHIINEITVTIGELEAIRKLNNLRLEKLAFVLLIYAKIYNIRNSNTLYWVNSPYKDIFEDANIKVTKKMQAQMIHKLVEKEMIECSVIVDCNNLKVLYHDNESDSHMTINDFRNFVLNYLKWRDEKIINCNRCASLIEKKGNKKKYCNVCAKEIKNEQNQFYKKKN